MLRVDRVQNGPLGSDRQRAVRPAGIGGARVLVALLVLVGAMLAGCGSFSSNPPPHFTPSNGGGPNLHASSSISWLVTSQALREMAAITSVGAVLRGDNVLEIAGSTGASFPGVKATTVMAFRSFLALEAWLQGASAPGTVRAVVYDPESWTFTPLAEQQNVGSYARQFVAAARLHGLIPILAPGLDLSRVLSPGSGSVSSGYLMANIPEEMGAALAGGTGYVEIQAQSLERVAGPYTSLVSDAAKAVLSRDPQATVLAGLSTNPSGGPVSLAEILADIKETRSLVTGYWLNVPGVGTSCPDCAPPDPSLGAAVLDHLS